MEVFKRGLVLVEVAAEVESYWYADWVGGLSVLLANEQIISFLHMFKRFLEFVWFPFSRITRKFSGFEGLAVEVASE